eukprot:11283257-Prorocentrum_lima.AAC.1
MHPVVGAVLKLVRVCDACGSRRRRVLGVSVVGPLLGWVVMGEQGWWCSVCGSWGGHLRVGGGCWGPVGG